MQQLAKLPRSNFLRNILQIPVPRILDYSASLKTSVGAEYIIMERAYGEILAPGWFSLSTKVVKHITTQTAKIKEKEKKKNFLSSFPGMGVYTTGVMSRKSVS